MSTVTDTKISIKADSSEKDDVFPAWKSSKDSMNPSPAGGGLKPPEGIMGRRKSNFKSLRGISEFRRMTLFGRTKSDVSADNIRPQVQKENTYKMVPDEGTEFSIARIKKAVSRLLEDECADLTYDQDISSKLTCTLAERIKEKVKELGFVRYKLAINLIVGQAGDQGIEVASRCCWNPSVDNYSCVTFKNKTMVVIALIYGIYFE